MVSISRPQIARPVAFRRFYLNDFGAIDSKQHGAVRRGYPLPKIDDAQAAIRRLMRREQLLFDCHLISGLRLTRWKLMPKQKRMGMAESRMRRALLAPGATKFRRARFGGHDVRVLHL